MSKTSTGAQTWRGEDIDELDELDERVRSSTRLDLGMSMSDDLNQPGQP